MLLEADGALFDEDSFRLSRRLGTGRTHGSSSNSGAGGTILGAGSASSNPEPVERDTSTSGSSSSRKSSYRIRDQRWYDSYRDELYSSSSNLAAAAASSHHHHHHHHHHRPSASQLDHSNSALINTAAAAAGAAESAAKQDEDKKSKQSTMQFTFGEQLQYFTDKVIINQSRLIFNFNNISNEFFFYLEWGTDSFQSNCRHVFRTDRCFNRRPTAPVEMEQRHTFLSFHQHW